MTFEEWLKTDCQPCLRPTEHYEKRQMRAAWNAANRAAREECAEICDGYASIEGIAQECAEAIRETIK